MAGEIEATLEIPHSALFALLNTLTSMGYLTQSGARQPYRPGPRLHALRHPHPPGTNALAQAFTEETNRHPPEETVALATLLGSGENHAEILFLAATPCEHEVRSVIRPGERARATEHPAGWVLLAGLSPGALTQHVASPSRRRCTAGWITSASRRWRSTPRATRIGWPSPSAPTAAIQKPRS